jgi:hypothetical protein
MLPNVRSLTIELANEQEGAKTVMAQRDGAHERDDDLGVVWGAGAIAKVIGRSRTQTYYMLKKGLIKAARKTGQLHHADVAGLRAQFCAKVTESAGSQADVA